MFPITLVGDYGFNDYKIQVNKNMELLELDDTLLINKLKLFPCRRSIDDIRTDLVKLN